MDTEKTKIVLCPNIESDEGLKMTLAAYDVLAECGRRAVICPLLRDNISFLGFGVNGSSLRDVEVAELESALPSAEMLITFGGDGTILHAAREAADFETPILGVNMGGKGFIAELETDDIGRLSEVASGRYELEKRMMLDVEVIRGEEPAFRDFALNDAVIKGDNKVIDLTLLGDGQRIIRFSGDGAIIATPTGSTAYSMAAGGPIVEPAAQNIIITPICAHILEAKSFVLVSDRIVSVEIGWRKHNPAYLSVDGNDHVNLIEGDRISVRKSEKNTQLVRLGERSFYEKVSVKLGEKFVNQVYKP